MITPSEQMISRSPGSSVAVLSEGDDDRARLVRDYERGHKARAGVLKAAERDLATA